MFHTTHHIQKRDLLWGCYTRVSTTCNPLWTKTTKVNNQLETPLLVPWGIIVYNGALTIRPAWQWLLYTFSTLLCTGIFLEIFNQYMNGITGKRYDFSFFKCTFYDQKHDFLQIFLNKRYVITEYKFNYITALPCFILLCMGELSCKILIAIHETILRIVP